MYTKTDIHNLINTLKEYDSTYEVLVDFFETYLKKGYFDLGLSNPGSQNSAFILKELKNMFPDVEHALFIPKEDLPLFITQTPEVSQEYPIACWRLKIDK